MSSQDLSSLSLRSCTGGTACLTLGNCPPYLGEQPVYPLGPGLSLHHLPSPPFFSITSVPSSCIFGLRCSYSDLIWGQQSPLDQCCDVFFSHCTHRIRQSKDERFGGDKTRLWVCLRCLSQPQTVGPSQSLKSFTRILRMDM